MLYLFPRSLQHQAGTSPPLRVRTVADGFPAPATQPLGTDGSEYPDSWGHMKPQVRELGSTCKHLLLAPGLLGLKTRAG